jgi:hypothetical protein
MAHNRRLGDELRACVRAPDSEDLLINDFHMSARHAGPRARSLAYSRSQPFKCPLPCAGCAVAAVVAQSRGLLSRVANLAHFVCVRVR